MLLHLAYIVKNKKKKKKNLLNFCVGVIKSHLTPADD